MNNNWKVDNHYKNLIGNDEPGKYYSKYGYKVSSWTNGYLDVGTYKASTVRKGGFRIIVNDGLHQLNV